MKFKALLLLVIKSRTKCSGMEYFQYDANKKRNIFVLFFVL